MATVGLCRRRRGKFSAVAERLAGQALELLIGRVVFGGEPAYEGPVDVGIVGRAHDGVEHLLVDVCAALADCFHVWGQRLAVGEEVADGRHGGVGHAATVGLGSDRARVRGAELSPNEQMGIALRALLVAASADSYGLAALGVEDVLAELDDEAVRDVAAQLALFPRYYFPTGDYRREPLEHFLLETTWSRS